MTITRLKQLGAELNNILSEFTSRSNTGVVTSATQAQSGTYSFRFEQDFTASIVLATNYTQLRCGFFAHHVGTGTGDDPSLITFRGGGVTGLDLRWDGGAQTFNLYRDTTLIDSILSAGFAAESAWHHIGIDLKTANSGGWFYLYLDGVEILSFDGDTVGSVSSIDTVRFGSGRTNQTWDNYLYIDDIYIDNLSGESTPAVVPDYRFLPVTPNGNGAHDDWDGNDGNSVDNYLLVDEIPPDDDTTYVESAVSGEQDNYAMTNPTIPTGWEVNAVIPFAIVKKLNAGGALNLKLETRTTISGSPSYVTSAAITLGTAYAIAWDRRATNPAGGSWTAAMVNDLEVGVITD
jgi:hypothetical protein